jgi:hypothetical protein
MQRQSTPIKFRVVKQDVIEDEKGRREKLTMLFTRRRLYDIDPRERGEH